MFFVHGKKSIRIRRFVDSSHSCKHCKVFDLNVSVYAYYEHLFFVPAMPSGEKSVKITCRNCGHVFRSVSLEEYYASQTKNPFYLYAAPLLLGLLIFFMVTMNLLAQRQKAAFLSTPLVGDVYMLRYDERKLVEYSFMKIVAIKGDKILMLQNRFRYDQFVSKLDTEDYFAKTDTFEYAHPELKAMLEIGDVVSIEREYEPDTGFNLIR